MSLNQLFDQFIGGQDASQSNGNKITNLTNNIPGGMMGGLAAGGLLGVLAGNKKARKTVGKMAGGAVGLGGAAILGAVAFNAYKNWQNGSKASSGQNQTPSPAGHLSHEPTPTADIDQTRFDPVTTQSSDGKPFQIALIKAMIAAANADGHIDSDEQASIFDSVNKLQLDASDKALVFDTLQNPPDVKTIAAFADGLEQASELYLVSRLAIDPDNADEQAYLKELSTRMFLPDDLVQHLEEQVRNQQLAPA